MAAIAAAVGVLAVPATASAATKTVDMGPPTEKTFQKAFSDVNDFFPHGTTIHVGDSVKFVPTGFHTVDIPERAGRRSG